MSGEEMPFKRVYVDLPTEVAKKLQVRAREARMTMKAYLANLINNDSGKTTPRSKVNA